MEVTSSGELQAAHGHVAFALCELARADHHRYRVLERASDQAKALRALPRVRENLVTSRVAMGNQLRIDLPGDRPARRQEDSPAFLDSQQSRQRPQ